MTKMLDQNEIVRRLADLRDEHRDLDHAIGVMASEHGTDQIRLKRLKKRKLSIKDTISRLKSMLIPDMDA